MQTMRPVRTLLITPPMVDPHVPYPATAYLTGFLREQGFDVRQSDLSLSLFLAIFSRQGLTRIRQTIVERLDQGSLTVEQPISHFLESAAAYLNTIDSVIRFLQGGDETLAFRIASRKFLPEGGNFQRLTRMPVLSGALATHGDRDRARFFAALYIRDLVEVVRLGVDGNFDVISYAERLAANHRTFDPLYRRLIGEASLIDRVLEELVVDQLKNHRPQLLGITVPFPGCVYGALRIGQLVKKHSPETRVALGGGYVNTELRLLSDARLFEFVDYLAYDDGELPLQHLIEHLQGMRSGDTLTRTLWLERATETIVGIRGDSPAMPRSAKAAYGRPTYDGLALGTYVPLVDSINPMERLWSEFKWNKLTLSHGCYWGKCSFCDLSLSYIKDYRASDPDRLLADIRGLIAETGQTGFHFVDEAAPPKLLSALSLRLIEGGVGISWWSNIRFDKAFTTELAELMSAAGCIAVTGGLEVASNRLLKLMNKGTTVEQVARVCAAFRVAGIRVHAYLMYGFPTQTIQETVDSLEVVRQLFLNRCLNSAYWHRFGVTSHSPIGQDPRAYGISLEGTGAGGESDDHATAPIFSVYGLRHTDPEACPHDMLGAGLKKALHHYMLGKELARPVETWFDDAVPGTMVMSDLIEQALACPASSGPIAPS